MAAGMSQAKINRKLRELQKKNPGEKYRVIRASNGEVAIITQKWYDLCMPKSETICQKGGGVK